VTLRNVGDAVSGDISKCVTVNVIINLRVQANCGHHQRLIPASFSEPDDVLFSLCCRENISRATVVRQKFLLLDFVAPCPQVRSTSLSSEQSAHYPLMAVAAVVSQGGSSTTMLSDRAQFLLRNCTTLNTSCRLTIVKLSLSTPG